MNSSDRKAMRTLRNVRIKAVAASLCTTILAVTCEMQNVSAEDQRITWEEMEKLEPSRLRSADDTIYLYRRLDLVAVTPEQTASLSARLKKIGLMRDGYMARSLSHQMLVQLRDEETVGWLLSQMGRGGSESAHAGEILRKSGQVWLLVRLERYVFLPPDAEPKIPPSDVSDVGYLSVSGNAFQVCCEIIRRSPEFTPKFKDWFEILSHLGAWGGSNNSRELLKPWWDDNRKRMTAGEFRELSIIPLWPQRSAPSEKQKDRFVRADFFDALASEFPTVRHLALERIKKQWVTDLSDVELRQIADTLPMPFSYARKLAADLLAFRGGEGITLLKKSLTDPDAEVRACAAMALLDSTKPTDAERKQYLREIVGSLGYLTETSRALLASNYLIQHPQLKTEVMPLLKDCVLDRTLPDVARTVTASQIAHWATKEDVPFLEKLLSSDFPVGVRGHTVHALCNLFPQGEPPDSIKKLANDPGVGPLIKDYHYLEKPRR